MAEERHTIKKLDSRERFDAIKTGILDANELKDNDRDRYRTWMNLISEDILPDPMDRDLIFWVSRHHRAIKSFIDRAYGGGNQSTYRAHLESLANVLLAIDKFKFRDTARDLFWQGIQLQRSINESNDENVMTPKDAANYIPYKRLVEARDYIGELWRADPDNLKLNMYYLILALNTYIPPLRLDWADMTIYTGEEEPPKDIVNYFWLPKNTVVINSDKIEHTRKAKGLPRQLIRIDDEIPNITDGAKLVEIIRESLQVAPRKYILVSMVLHGPMGRGYDKALSDMFRPKNPRQNLIRRAYINHWYPMKIDGRALTERQLKEIAIRMRHSVETARSQYMKIDAADVEEKEEEPYAYIDRSPIRRSVAPDALFKKERRKLVERYNRDPRYGPNHSTVVKYNLKQDPVSGLWD
jgi:hypothetical protein